MSANAATVFVSYSHDSTEHSKRVLELAQTLNHEGVDTEIDQYYEDKLIDWPRWCEERLRPENSDFVVMICSAEYRRRLENRVKFDEGRGVFWEGALIYRELYNTKSNERFIPVLLDNESADSIPAIISNWAHFRIRTLGISGDDPGYTGLYRLLTDQPRISKGKVGITKVLSPVTPRAVTSRNEPAAHVTKTVQTVQVETKKCRPFSLEVFVGVPETGYRFQLLVEKACSEDNDPIWKLVFDLYKKNDAEAWDQIVHVSFRGVDPKERQGIENLSIRGLSGETATIITKEVHPAAKAVAVAPKPTASETERLNKALSRAAVSAA